MRIAYVFDRPLPARETDSEQALRTISALVRNGARVRLIVPSGPSGATSAEAIAEHYGVEPSFDLATLPSPLSRWSTARKWWHARAALDERCSREVDVVYTRNFPTLFSLAGGRTPFAYETYRPWASQFPFLRPFFKRAMSAENFVGAILHSRFARDRYRTLGVDEDKLLVAHNGHDPALFADKPDRAELRRKLGLPVDSPLVVYAGHVNLTKGLTRVVDMARRLPHVCFALVGSDGRGVVEALASRRPNVRIIEWQPFSTVTDYLVAADVLLQPPSNVPLSLVGNTVLPMKLFLYLAAGRAIVAPDLPDMRELLRHDENALLVPAGDFRGAADAIERLVRDPSLAERLSAAARADSLGLTWDARAKRIVGFLSERLKPLHGIS